MKIRKWMYLFWVGLMLAACAPIPAAVAVSPTVQPAALAAATVTASPPPGWLDQPLHNVKNGESFSLRDLQGKVVLVNGIATWCPTCFKESRYLKTLSEQYASRNDFAIVTLGFDMKEDDEVIQSYAGQFGFNWRFAIPPLMVYREIGNTYGALYLDPTLSPMFIIDRQGNVHPYNLGTKTLDDIRQKLDPILLDESA